MFFKQRKAKLPNGQVVKEGDWVEWISSDNVKCVGQIKRNINNPKKLYFWNNQFEISDYVGAVKVDPPEAANKEAKDYG